MAGLVAHHVAQHLPEQRLLGHLVHEAERGERQPLDHHLHAEVGHVPPGVVDDVVEQHPQVGVDLVAAAHLLVEIAGEHLDVAGLVDDLRGGVQLGVVPRHGLGDLGGAQQRTLLAVEELRQRPLAVLDAERQPLLLAPVADHGVVVEVGVDAGGDADLVARHDLFEVDFDRPVEVGGSVPLSGLGLLVQLAKLRPLQQ